MEHHIVQEALEASDGRRTAPAALRNTNPLIRALRARLPGEGTVLEVASGTGQHAAAFAAAFPDLSWVPSDVDPRQRESIAAWRRTSGLGNLDPPLEIDVATSWPVARASARAVLTINLLHLIPEDYISKLFEEARKALTENGRMIVYGPFLRGSSYASDGDRDFDVSLQSRDPAIGYKSVEAVSEAAMEAGLVRVAQDEMPANNLLLSFVAP